MTTDKKGQEASHEGCCGGTAHAADAKQATTAPGTTPDPQGTAKPLVKTQSETKDVRKPKSGGCCH